MFSKNIIVIFRGRFGTTTCALAGALQNSGRLLAVEPDPSSWFGLQQNLRVHRCAAHVLKAAVSATNVTVETYDGINPKRLID